MRTQYVALCVCFAAGSFSSLSCTILDLDHDWKELSSSAAIVLLETQAVEVFTGDDEKSMSWVPLPYHRRGDGALVVEPREGQPRNDHVLEVRILVRLVEIAAHPIRSLSIPRSMAWLTVISSEEPQPVPPKYLATVNFADNSFSVEPLAADPAVLPKDWRYDEAALERVFDLLREAAPMIESDSRPPLRFSNWALRMALEQEGWDRGLRMLQAREPSASVSVRNSVDPKPYASYLSDDDWGKMAAVIARERFVTPRVQAMLELMNIWSRPEFGPLGKRLLIETARAGMGADGLSSRERAWSWRQLYSELFAYPRAEQLLGPGQSFDVSVVFEQSPETLLSGATSRLLTSEDRESAQEMARHMVAAAVRLGHLERELVPDEWWQPDRVLESMLHTMKTEWHWDSEEFVPEIENRAGAEGAAARFRNELIRRMRPHTVHCETALKDPLSRSPLVSIDCRNQTNETGSREDSGAANESSENFVVVE